MKRIMIIGMLVLMSFSVSAATVSHSASEVMPGGFASGDYSFDGNVGIGTSVPTQLLTVEKNNANTNLLIKSIGTGNWAQLLYGDEDSDTVGAVIYNHNSDFMAFHVNDNEKMRISENGNVGIGAIPDVGRKLVINDTNAVLSLMSDNSGTSSLFLGDQSDDNVGDIQYDNSNNKMSFKTAGSQNLVIDSSGNVGIGTTDPGGKLEVQGSQILLDGVATAGTTSLVVNTAAARHAMVHLQQAGSDVWRMVLDSDDSLDFDQGPGLERMTILDGGNVGIGTTSPNSILEIYRSGGADLILGDDTVRAKWRTNGGGTSWIGTTSDHDFQVVTHGGAKIHVENSGNVGIGTTSPDVKLDIEGAAKVKTFSTSTLPPACSSSTRGAIINWQPGSNPDRICWCKHAGSGNYKWTDITSGTEYSSSQCQ